MATEEDREFEENNNKRIALINKKFSFQLFSKEEQFELDYLTDLVRIYIKKKISQLNIKGP